MNWPSTIVFVGAVGLWALATALLNVPSYVFPSPLDVVNELMDSFNLMMINTSITALESFFGAVLGLVVGLALGAIMALRRWAETALLPYVVGSNAVPVIAIAPLIALWFGYGLLSKVVVAAFLCFFPVAINTYDGLRERRGVLRELFYVIGASRGFYFRHCRLPLAIPNILSGSKISLVFAVIGAVVAEFVGADAGLGFGMVQAVYSLNTPRLFAYIIIACGLGLLFYGAVALCENLLRRSKRWSWAFQQRSEGSTMRINMY